MRQHAEFLPEFEVPKFLEEIPIEECIEEIEFASKKRVFRAPARSATSGCLQRVRLGRRTKETGVLS